MDRKAIVSIKGGLLYIAEMFNRQASLKDEDFEDFIGETINLASEVFGKIEHSFTFNCEDNQLTVFYNICKGFYDGKAN